MNNPTLHVRIISPRQLILETEAASISSKNSQGNFDILPQHANFITMVENTPIIVRPASPTGGPASPDASQGGPAAQKELTFKFPLAIIVTRENKVDIYTYIQPQEKK